MATLDNDDLKAIKALVEVTIDERLDEKLDEKLSHLPTKDEFYEKMDQVMGELKSIREEHAVLSHQVADHDDRIEKIENHVGISSN
jgi:predicted nuclease with TOPRIM domain